MNCTRIGSPHLCPSVLKWIVGPTALAFGMNAASNAPQWVSLVCSGQNDTMVRYSYSKELEQVTVEGRPVSDVTYLAGTFTFTTVDGDSRLMHQLSVPKALLRIVNLQTGQRTTLRRCVRVNDETLTEIQPQ